MIYKLYALISLALVAIAPGTYSYEYCMLLVAMFFVVFGTYIVGCRKGGIVTFGFFFSVSFMFVNFVYPVHYYPTRPYFSLFIHHFDPNLISYCTALALCAYCMLICGLTSMRTAPRTAKRFVLEPVLHRRLIVVFEILFLITLALFITTDGLNYFLHQFARVKDAADVESSYIFALLQTCAIPLLLLSLLWPRHRSPYFWLPLSSVVFLSLLVLATGSRTFPMAVAVMSVALYNDRVRRVPPLFIIAGLCAAVVLLSIVGYMRGDGMIDTSDQTAASALVDKKSGDWLSFAQELIINNRSLYALVEYTKDNGVNYGMTLLGSLLGIVPFLAGWFIDFTGIHSDFLNSAGFNTYLVSGHFRHQGLGTNCVADIYIAFGLVGVIVFFYLAGRVIQWLRRRSASNIYCYTAYYVIFSGAVYIPRATFWGAFCGMARSVAILAVAMYFVRMFTDHKRKQKIPAI